jgi:hypothetical protein
VAHSLNTNSPTHHVPVCFLLWCWLRIELGRQSDNVLEVGLQLQQVDIGRVRCQCCTDLHSASRVGPTTRQSQISSHHRLAVGGKLHSQPADRPFRHGADASHGILGRVERPSNLCHTIPCEARTRTRVREQERGRESEGEGEGEGGSERGSDLFELHRVVLIRHGINTRSLSHPKARTVSLRSCGGFPGPGFAV